MMNKGLAVIYDPHNLYQFVWYYCNKGNKKEWDALCLPNGYKGEYMHTYCEASGIFQNIYKDETDFSMLPLRKKLNTFIQMVGYFLIGRRTTYCKKLINQFVNVDDYDDFVVIADVGIVSGACIALGKEKNVVILEDGINDYGERPRFIAKNKRKSLYAWQGFLLSLMGYCSPGWYRLRTDKECIKYCSQPEKMIYKEYREIRTLYSNKGTDIELFDEIIKKIYPKLSNYNFNKFEAVIMTRPLNDFVNDQDKYIKRLESYIKDKNKSILVKKHPREQYNYLFQNAIEIDNSIPAEAILPYLKSKEIIVITTSSILLYFKSFGLSCEVVLFKGMYEENIRSNTSGKTPSLEDVTEFADRFCDGCYKVVQI